MFLFSRKTYFYSIREVKINENTIKRSGVVFMDSLKNFVGNEKIIVI